MAHARKLTVRPRILKKELRSIEGIWMRHGNGKLALSSTITMEKETSTTHDIVLAAISVVPAAILWVFVGLPFLAAAAIGIGLLLGVEYGYPALKSGRIDIELALRQASQLRESIRARSVRAS